MIDYITPQYELWLTAWVSDNNGGTNANSGTWVYAPFAEDFPCSPDDIFCILVEFKSYTMNMLWSYKDEKLWKSLAAIVSTYNENFRDWAYSRLAQKRMTTNNFEFGYNLDLGDVFSMWVYVFFEPIPMFNMPTEDELKDKDWNTFDENKYKKDRIVKNAFDAYGLDYYRQNNLANATKELYDKTNLQYAEIWKIWKATEEDHDAEDYQKYINTELLEIELDIEKKMSENSDFSDFNVSFTQLDWVIWGLNDFAKNLYWVTGKLKNIPTSW
jgi:hypothetical protein